MFWDAWGEPLPPPVGETELALGAVGDVEGLPLSISGEVKVSVSGRTVVTGSGGRKGRDAWSVVCGGVVSTTMQGTHTY